MWWRLAGLWVVMAALVTLLFLPIPTHAVKLEMSSGGDLHQVKIIAQWFSVTVPALVVLAILAVCIWLNIRIIRCYRKSG